MNILLSANEDFASYSKLLLSSIRRKNKCEISIHFFYIKLKKETIDNITKYVTEKLNMKIYFYQINDKMFEHLPKTNMQKTAYFGPEAYLRLFAQYVLPSNIDKVLYIDIDIICDGYLSKLYNCDFKNMYYIGCKDYGITYDDYCRIGFSNDDNYINSGVLLINLKLLREKIKIDELRKYILSNKDIISYPDQDIINMFYKNKILIVNNKYNYTQLKEQENIKNAILYHYIGKNKPWVSKKIYRIKFQFIRKYLKNVWLEKRILKSFILFCYYCIMRPIYLTKKVCLRGK